MVFKDGFTLDGVGRTTPREPLHLTLGANGGLSQSGFRLPRRDACLRLSVAALQVHFEYYTGDSTAFRVAFLVALRILDSGCRSARLSGGSCPAVRMAPDARGGGPGGPRQLLVRGREERQRHRGLGARLRTL